VPLFDWDRELRQLTASKPSRAGRKHERAILLACRERTDLGHWPIQNHIPYSSTCVTEWQRLESDQMPGTADPMALKGIAHAHKAWRGF
jgi:hypothetical protein